MFTDVTDMFRSRDAEDKPVKTPSRPTIGLALGGGAARGWSHIGALRALNEAGIYPDIVTGTSIGAVVGGCYLAGELDRIEQFACSLTKRRVFGLLDFKFAGSGLITGARLTKLLQQYLKGVTIESLDKPYICVATELGTGHEIWLRRGPLVEAMSASYALPGIFQPVNTGGRWLVDGALVNPVPVSTCRALGARIVIAVNLNSDSFGRGALVPDHAASENDGNTKTKNYDDEDHTARGLIKREIFGDDSSPPGITSVMLEAFNIIQDRISRSRLAGDPPDVMITPHVRDIGLFDFHRAREAIDAGYQATSRAITDINQVNDIL